MNRTLYLVDVSSMFFRAFYAVRPLSNSKGLPTNAVFGFMSMAVKLLRESKPEYIAFCLDSKEPSFRKEIDANYKANRTEMPDDLSMQMPYILRVADCLGISSIGHSGYEADDIIGTMATRARANGMDVVIVSGDKDFAQLIGPGVVMYDTMKEIKFDEKAVQEKWGVPPERFRDYLAIVGDTSDNIPGVAGVGPKGACKLLADFNSLEEIYENLDKISSKSVREKLENSRESAFRAQKLVSIVTDMKIPVELEDLKLKEIPVTELCGLLQELEFKTFERLIAGAPNAGALASAAPATVVSSAAAPATAIEKAAPPPQKIVSSKVTEIEEVRLSSKEFLKTVAHGSDVWLVPAGGAYAFGQDDKIYIVEDQPADWIEQLSKKNFCWSGFDLKSAWRTLHLKNPVARLDLMLAIYVLRPQEVKDFAQEYMEFCLEEIPPMVSATQMYQALLHLAEKLLEKLPQQQSTKVLEEIEHPIISILYEMEECGVRVDTDSLRQQSKELSAQISQLEAEVYEAAEEVFNIGSPKQLSRILFEKLKLPVQKKTKTGYSTDSDVLEALAHVHPICEKLIQYREVTKLKSTYVDALPALLDQTSGRIHTTFNQALTATGRLSSSNPNLQNIPIRTERGQQIRKAFIASDGCVLVSADYSQIELRILAHITGDPGLVHAFQEDLDIHTATAAEIFGVGLSDVTPDLRRAAKAVNFGIAYGQGAFGLAQALGIPRGEGQNIIDRYFKRFSKVAQFMNQTVEQAKTRGYVETLFGRRRYLPELKSANQGIRKFGERAAINAPIQGTASDLVKMAMIRVHNNQALHDLHLRMILQVHDELVFEVPNAKAEAASRLVESDMSHVFAMNVPLKVNVGIGPNWDEAH